FGFPLDLSQELAREKGLEVDEAGFGRELEEQKRKARLSWKGDLKQKEKKVLEELRDVKVVPRVHEADELADIKILALLKDGRRTASLAAGETGEAVLAETPFYAEAGGQVGDTGVLKGARFSAMVENVYFLGPEIIAHKVKVLSGEMKAGDAADAAPDLVRRQSVSNNHTATHLLHAALRQVLGDHVKQAGSLVSAARLRFDFTHFAHLSREELRRVEALVNEDIRADIPVTTRVTSLDEGIREGATAIFEEKYGEKVRVVSIGDVSKELCGGVHVNATGRIGLFKILSESSVASGMRRIEAVTGEEALRYLGELEDLVGGLEKSLATTRKELPARIEKLRDGLESAEKENKALRKKIAFGAGSIEGKSPVSGKPTVIKSVKGIAVDVQRVEGLAMADLREMADALKQKLGSGVVFLGASDGEKVFLVAAVSKDLTGRISAGALIKEAAPVVGGGGGGRPDFAQAGGNRPEALDKVLEMVPGMVEKLLA
ncbi:MAG: alanine--tRNA ligase-related protein, partial [Acidobacteriota bacterium]